jgi:hypothetical protein
MRFDRFAYQSATSSFRIAGTVRWGRALLIIGGLGSWALNSSAQTSDFTRTDQSKSWTSTSDLKTEHVNPIRVIESHRQTGNRTTNTQAIYSGGSDGHMEPYQDIEKETLEVDPNTVRITTRTFDRDSNGRKTLVQVTEEEARTLEDGNSKIVRLTYNPDLSGKLQPVQREIVESKSVGLDVEIDTTVMLASINGGLAPAFKTHEVRKRSANNTIESTKTTLLQDGEGRWQVNEVRQATSRQEETNHTTEERVFRLDSERKLGEFSRVVNKESESASGEKRNIVETFSVDVPGATQDGKLHLIERTISTQGSSSTGEQITEEQVEKLNPGDPGSGLHVSVVTTESVRSGPSGEQATRTISMRQLNGNFGVVSVQTTASDKAHTISSQQTPSGKTK